MMFFLFWDQVQEAMLYLVVMSPSLIQAVKISQRPLDFYDLDSVKTTGWELCRMLVRVF